MPSEEALSQAGSASDDDEPKFSADEIDYLSERRIRDQANEFATWLTFHTSRTFCATLLDVIEELSHSGDGAEMTFLEEIREGLQGIA
jgi:hypothetical protein